MKLFFPSWPDLVPDQESELQYGTKTWLAWEKYGFSWGSADRIPPTALTEGHRSELIRKRSRWWRSEQLRSSWQIQPPAKKGSVFLVITQNFVAIDLRYIHSARVLQKEKSNGGKSQLKVQSQGVLKVDNPTLSLFLIEAPRVVVSTPPARQNDPLILWCSL